MLSAKEAREAFEQSQKEEQVEELRQIDDAIRYAIRHEDNAICTSQTLYQENIQTLRDQGYKVKYKFGFLFSDPHWEISW